MKNMKLLRSIANCRREQARCLQYAGPDDLMALMGWADWKAEENILWEEWVETATASELGDSK